MRRYETHFDDAPADMVAAERLEAIAHDQERTADALERLADAAETYVENQRERDYATYQDVIDAFENDPRFGGDQ